jgi:hypothetical protein
LRTRMAGSIPAMTFGAWPTMNEWATIGECATMIRRPA